MYYTTNARFQIENSGKTVRRYELLGLQTAVHLILVGLKVLASCGEFDSH